MKRYTLTTILITCVCACMTVFAQHNPNTIIAPTESRSIGNLVTVSANSQYIMTASRTVEIWNVNSGDRISIFNEFDRPFYDSSGMRLIPGGIATTSFSPDGTLAVTGGTDFTAMIWEVKTGALLQSLRLDDNVEFGLGNVSTAAISPDNKWMAASATSFDGIILFDISTGERMRIVNSERAVGKLQFFDNGEKLFYTTGQFARVYDLILDQIIFEKNIGGAELSENERSIIIHYGNSVQEWSIDGSLLSSNILSGFSGSKIRPAISPVGNRIAVAESNKSQILSKNNLSPSGSLRELSKGSSVDLVGHAFSPNGKLYYAYTKDKVFIYDISDLTSSASDTKSLK